MSVRRFRQKVLPFSVVGPEGPIRPCKTLPGEIPYKHSECELVITVTRGLTHYNSSDLITALIMSFTE